MPTPITHEAIRAAAAERKARIQGYMTETPPKPLQWIRRREGLSDRTLRLIMKEIEGETGINFGALNIRPAKDDLPYGMTQATARLRQKLGDLTYLLRERGNNSDLYSRNSVAPLLGLNGREQLRAEQRPFNHDWTLSQIERLAREHNRSPVELLLSCLTG
jgi:hypothetical protein